MIVRIDLEKATKLGNAIAKTFAFCSALCIFLGGAFVCTYMLIHGVPIGVLLFGVAGIGGAINMVNVLDTIE